MAQCRADDRKQHSAMDMYVGILHSKLHGVGMETEKHRQHWTGYGAESFNKEEGAAAAASRSSPYSTRSFREDPDLKPRAHYRKEDGSTATTSSSSSSSSSSSTSSLRQAIPMTRNGRYGSFDASRSGSSNGELSQPIEAKRYHSDICKESALGPSMEPPADKIKVRISSDSNNNEGKCESSSGPHLGTQKEKKKKPGAAMASSDGPISIAHNDAVDRDGADALKQDDAATSPSSSSSSSSSSSMLSSLRIHGSSNSSRSHKSAEQTMAPNGRPGISSMSSSPSHSNQHHARLHKSGDQTSISPKNLKGTAHHHHHHHHHQQQQQQQHHQHHQGGLGLFIGADSSPVASTSNGGRRWSSTGSADCTIFTAAPASSAKDSRRASFNGGTSSSASASASAADGATPVSNADSWRRSPGAGGYGSSTDPNPKDPGSRSNVLNSKDGSSNLRGMGNILSGASINGSIAKSKASSSSSASASASASSTNKQVGGFGDRVESCIAKKADDANSHPVNSGLGNLCGGSRWNSSVPMGNILNHHASSSRSSTAKPIEDSRNACPPSIDDPEEIKNAANELYKKGNFSEAVALYEKSIAMCPNHAPYRSNRAAALIGLGRLGEAVQECEEAIRLDPHYTRAHQRAAYLYLRLGLIESAKRHSTEAKDTVHNLQTVERHISRCLEARKVGNWRNTLAESNAAIAAGADSAPQVLGYKSEALLKLHKQEEAEAVCAEAQKLEASLCKLGVVPADSFLHMLRAHIEMSLGRFDDAVQAAESAVKLDPRSRGAVGLLRKARSIGQARRLGNELFNAGKFFEACAAYGEGLESDPANAVLLCNRAACRSKIGQWEKAIEDCNAALNAQPTYIKALMRRAHCNAKLEQWEDALNDYEVLRRELPNDMVVARGFFDLQVAMKKSRGEETHRMRFGGGVEEVLDKDQFRAVVNSPGLSVVEFVTRRNDRCREISSFVDQLCQRYPCVHFVKVDVDDNPVIAKDESLTFIPTFKIFKNGQKLKEIAGPSQQALECAVKHYSF